MHGPNDQKNLREDRGNIKKFLARKADRNNILKLDRGDVNHKSKISSESKKNEVTNCSERKDKEEQPEKKDPQIQFTTIKQKTQKRNNDQEFIIGPFPAIKIPHFSDRLLQFNDLGEKNF